MTTTADCYYVYVLFDHLGVPRYVGKGKGNRWENHKPTDPHNKMKAAFIRRTLVVLGEVPKIRVRENLSEAEAFATEVAFIAHLGRRSLGTGPLTNLTAGGDGFDSETASKHWHEFWSKLTPEQRSELVRKTKTPEQLSAAGRKSQAGKTPEQLSAAGRKFNAGLSPEQRSALQRELQAARTPEQLSAAGRKGALALNLTLTSEQKRANGHKGVRP